jgi:hypothetical protein
MTVFNTEKYTLHGYEVTIELWQDNYMGAPWKEHDGHGPVREISSIEEKRPGEVLLNSYFDRRSYNYAYDVQAAQKQALSEGWGFEGAKTGLSKRQVAATVVQKDIAHLRGWLNNDWHWTGYNLTVTKGGEEIDTDTRTVGGYDCENACLDDAKHEAEYWIKKHIEQTQKEREEADYWASRDMITV